MPTQTGKSLLMSKFGDKGRAAFNASEGSTKEFGGQSRCPAGVEGIAQLTKCRVQEIKEGKENAGELIFYAEGRVQQPTHHKGVSIHGTMVTLTENLFDTPKASGERKTLADHLEYVRWFFKLFGITNVAFENIETVATALQTQKPCFRFRSWAGNREIVAQGADGKWRVYEEDEHGKKTPSKRTTGTWPTEEAAKKSNPYADGRDPRVTYFWNAKCDFTVNGSTAVKDATGEVPDQDNQTPDAEPEGTNTTEPDDAGAGEFNEFSDLENLAVTADSIKNPKDATTEQSNATKALTKMALEAGITQEEIDDVTTWGYLAKMIQKKRDEGASSGGDEAATEEDDDDDTEPPADENAPPARGEVWRMKLKNPKTGRMAFTNVEIVGVSTKNSTCTVKREDNGKPVNDSNGKPLNVPWAELSLPPAD